MIVDTLNTVHLWWGPVQPIHLSTKGGALDDNYSSHNVHYRRRSISSLRRLSTHNELIISVMSLSHGGYHRSFYFLFELQTALQFWTLRPQRLSRNDQAVGCATTKWLKGASLHLQFVALEQGFLANCRSRVYKAELQQIWSFATIFRRELRRSTICSRQFPLRRENCLNKLGLCHSGTCNQQRKFLH